MFAAVKPYIEKADVAFANQESIIGGVEIGLSTYPSFNSPIEIADALAFTGFDVMSLANNHALDRGEQALQRSLSYWDKLNIVRTGAYTSQEDRNTIRTFSKNGITCAVLSYTYGLNGIDTLQKPYLVNLMQPEQMKQDVEQAKQIADAVIVILHFGTEYETLPNSSQKEVTQFSRPWCFCYSWPPSTCPAAARVSDRKTRKPNLCCLLPWQLSCWTGK
ncbi:CapA family protein [Ectobacillus funiculus]